MAKAVSATTGMPDGRGVVAEQRQGRVPVDAGQLEVHQDDVGLTARWAWRPPSSPVVATRTVNPAYSSTSLASLRLRLVVLDQEDHRRRSSGLPTAGPDRRGGDLGQPRGQQAEVDGALRGDELDPPVEQRAVSGR